MMGVNIINKKTFITSRQLLLLVLHQKPLRLESRVRSISAAVPSIGLGFAALFPGNFKTILGSEKSILQVVSSPLLSTSPSPSACVKKKNKLVVLSPKTVRRSAGEIQPTNLDYLVDFTDDRHHTVDHILDDQLSLTFRCVTTSYSYSSSHLSGSVWVNKNNLASWSYYYKPFITSICPIRTLTSSAIKANINMSNDDIKVRENIGNIQDMRKPYRQDSDVFDIKDLTSEDPLTQFGSWFQEACKNPDIKEPNAIALATASRSGQPSVRMVLLKGFGKEGFKIFTNFDSRKGKELMENPLCSICIHWEPLNRSVRIEGKVVRLSEEESCKYFNSRPRSSQLGAIVSNQSTIIPNREYLMTKFHELEKEYGDEKVIPKPDYWGGYLIVPDVIEFWQGQTTRIHDRLRFRKKEPNEVLDPELTHEGLNGWVIERLSP